MEEKYMIILLSLSIIAIAGIFAYYFSSYTPFNFYSSQLSLNGRNVTETLHFIPDRPYHTLFRTFFSPVASSGNNYVSISSVRCSSGTPYYREYYGAYYTFQNGKAINDAPLPNTKKNEYGCTFGYVSGFNQGIDYSTDATYTLSPANLFLINGKYYIKFVAYSANNHIDLKSGVNFMLNGGVTAQEFQPNQDVVVYIPYNGSAAGFSIINQDSFGFDSGSINYSVFTFFAFLIPLILFDGIWIFLERQKKEPAPPSQLSDIPTDRKPWEVSVYFNPPLMAMNKNFYATLMLDFYRRKIIDIRYVDSGIFDKKTFVKINSDPKDLDDIEQAYLQFLKDLGITVPDENRDGEYFDVNKANAMSGGYKFHVESIAIQKSIKDDGKKFIDVKGYDIFLGLMIALIYIALATATIPLLISSLLFIFITGLLHLRTPLLMKYKEDFYEEYGQWMAFKHGLSFLSSVKTARSDVVVQWEKYLVYATALGVADKVLEQLKSLNIADSTRLNNYSRAYVGSTAFSTSMASSGGGGGAGGGGVGGGGGGGR